MQAYNTDQNVTTCLHRNRAPSPQPERGQEYLQAPHPQAGHPTSCLASVVRMKES